MISFAQALWLFDDDTIASMLRQAAYYNSEGTHPIADREADSILADLENELAKRRST